MQIKEAITKEEIIFCGKAMLEFRQNLDPNTYVEQTLRMMKDGFRLLYIENEEKTSAAAILGFRVQEMLRTGVMIYIDDLFTFSDSRGKGYAGSLLKQVDIIAAERGIKSVTLDSGFTLYPAHRLYLNSGYVLGAHHFVKAI
jgi:GNAT superfamily N-acetyltransferase